MLSSILLNLSFIKRCISIERLGADECLIACNFASVSSIVFSLYKKVAQVVLILTD